MLRNIMISILLLSVSAGSFADHFGLRKCHSSVDCKRTCKDGATPTCERRECRCLAPETNDKKN